jgi:cytoplasmic iron level regulating protein YaaA (DUF328/UPF0246 family)
VLILVPPSESKALPPDTGPPVDLAGLSFPELTGMRAAILDALIETSAGPDAFTRLFERPSMAGWIARNTRLRDLPTRPAAEVYTGPLHVGLDLRSLRPADDGPGAAASGPGDIDDRVVILSVLWGPLRPSDRIPPYRMRVWSDLVGVGRVEMRWRGVLPELLARLAGDDGLVFDLRPPSIQALGMPAGIGHRTVAIRVDALSTDGRRIGDVIAKRTRGEAGHLVLATGADPTEPDELADLLGDRWPVRLEPPPRPRQPWQLTLTIED